MLIGDGVSPCHQLHPWMCAELVCLNIGCDYAWVLLHQCTLFFLQWRQWMNCSPILGILAHYQKQCLQIRLWHWGGGGGGGGGRHVILPCRLVLCWGSNVLCRSKQIWWLETHHCYNCFIMKVGFCLFWQDKKQHLFVCYAFIQPFLHGAQSSIHSSSPYCVLITTL